MKKIDIRSLTMLEMETLMKDMGEKSFRGKQVYQWLNKKLVTSFEEMTNISKELRNKLQDETFISEAIIMKKLVSSENKAENDTESKPETSLKMDAENISHNGTIKYLFQMNNDTIIESVLLKYSYGNTVCISTQAGCRMGCSFCASTIGGLQRNLTAGELCAQIYEIQKDVGERVSNVVLMGSGEPFDNYDAVLKFIEIINGEDGLNIGQRSITVSTCGIVDKIYDFTERNLQVTLAISLHAPNDEIRNQIMPIARKNKFDELLAACQYYGAKTKRRVTYEYALISGVNDSIDHGKELGYRLRRTLCHVNLIPVNRVEEKGFEGSSKDAVKKFAETLESYGIETTIRRKLGSDINAACGQLRRTYTEGT